MWLSFFLLGAKSWLEIGGDGEWLVPNLTHALRSHSLNITTETKLQLINSVVLVWAFLKSLLLHVNFLSFLLTPCS